MWTENKIKKEKTKKEYKSDKKQKKSKKKKNNRWQSILPRYSFYYPRIKTFREGQWIFG